MATTRQLYSLQSNIEMTSFLISLEENYYNENQYKGNYINNLFKKLWKAIKFITTVAIYAMAVAVFGVIVGMHTAFGITGIQLIYYGGIFGVVFALSYLIWGIVQDLENSKFVHLQLNKNNTCKYR